MIPSRAFFSRLFPVDSLFFPSFFELKAFRFVPVAFGSVFYFFIIFLFLHISCVLRISLCAPAPSWVTYFS